MAGFDDKSTKELVWTLTNMRNGLDSLVPLDDETLNSPKGDKECPPSMGGALWILLIPQVEAALWKRGVDPRTIPGFDWGSLV